jgi:hypothetical protein
MTAEELCSQITSDIKGDLDLQGGAAIVAVHKSGKIQVSWINMGAGQALDVVNAAKKLILEKQEL